MSQDVVQLDDRKVKLGPRCGACQSTEARCARVGGCCARCGHFGPRLHLIAANPCGTERGYQRHRYRRERTCGPCKVAHGRHNQDAAS